MEAIRVKGSGVRCQIRAVSPGPLPPGAGTVSFTMNLTVSGPAHRPVCLQGLAKRVQAGRATGGCS